MITRLIVVTVPQPIQTWNHVVHLKHRLYANHFNEKLNHKKRKKKTAVKAPQPAASSLETLPLEPTVEAPLTGVLRVWVCPSCRLW